MNEGEGEGEGVVYLVHWKHKLFMGKLDGSCGHAEGVKTQQSSSQISLYFLCLRVLHL